mgnify:FL=1
MHARLKARSVFLAFGFFLQSPEAQGARGKLEYRRLRVNFMCSWLLFGVICCSICLREVNGLSESNFKRLSIRFRRDVYQQLEALASELGIGVGTLVQWIVGNYLRSSKQMEGELLDKVIDVMREAIHESEGILPEEEEGKE